MTIRLKNLEIAFSSWFLIALPALYIIGLLDEYLLAMASIALHELGHIAAASYKSCRIGSVRVTPVGLSASIDESGCGRSTLIGIYICGPLVNLLIAALSAILYIFVFGKLPEIRNISILNVSLALFNLLPALPLDGGKILLELLSGRLGTTEAGKSAKRAALALAAVFIAAGSWQFIRDFGNFSLLAIGIFIVASLVENRMEAAFMNIRQILYRRSRFVKKGIYPVRSLAVMKWFHIGECLKCMDYDMIHIIHVLDDDMTIMASFTESVIIETLLSNASDMTFEELVNNSGRCTSG